LFAFLAVSFAGLGFLSWYLAGKIRAFDRGGHVAKLCIVILPLLLAAMVGVSRVDDYWHHWQDVFAGGILGRFQLSHKVVVSSENLHSLRLSIVWVYYLCRIGGCFVLLPAVLSISLW
jgi:hypothetical protein